MYLYVYGVCVLVMHSSQQSNLVTVSGIDDERSGRAVGVDGRNPAASRKDDPRELHLLQPGVPVPAPDALHQAAVRPHVHQHGERHAA